MTETHTSDSMRVSYWAVVWGQLRSDRIAVAGIGCVVFLFALATFAPVIALDQPFYLSGPEGTRFPWFAILFNRLFFENSVDVFFNLLMILSPLYLALYFGATRCGARVWRLSRPQILYGLTGLHLLIFLIVAPETFFGISNPLYGMAPIPDSAETVSGVFPPIRQNYRSADSARRLQSPGGDHLLGTDGEGRDVLARVLYGTRISLTIGVVAVSIYVLIGIVLGALAGYFGGWIDIAISRLVEVMICFPTFFLILTLAAFIEERSIFHVMAIIGITGWPKVARLVRAEFLKQKNLEYAQAALALGIPRLRIIFRHILPNALAPVLVTATFGVASAILVESSLSFLGLGDVTAPSWGALLNAGRIEQKIWLVLAPGIPIFFVVSVFNLVGEGLRDALDPKLRK